MNAAPRAHTDSHSREDAHSVCHHRTWTRRSSAWRLTTRGARRTRGPPLTSRLHPLSSGRTVHQADPRPYFLTGAMDVALYDEQCEFADPFVAFRGRDRFVANLENLAGERRPPACNPRWP